MPCLSRCCRHVRALFAVTAFTLLGASVQAGNPDTLTTQYSFDTSGADGNMFNILAHKDLTIVGLDANFDFGQLNFEIYTAPLSYVGNTGNAGAWTLVGSGQVSSNGPDLPTPMPFTQNVNIPLGQSMGFYVTCTGTGDALYTGGSLPGVAASNADMTITMGISLFYPFGQTYSTYIWNGTVYYSSEVGTSYCAGDGTGGLCPCGNLGVAEGGCQNSRGLAGVLHAEGSTSVGTDNLMLIAKDLPMGRPALLVAGSMSTNGGLGAGYGDGLLCASGAMTYFGVQVSGATGDVIWGPGLASSGALQPGSSSFFQVLYRDSSTGSPCGLFHNGTNGVRVDLQP